MSTPTSLPTPPLHSTSTSLGRSLNDYHIYEEIGTGKNSVVYKGRKKKTIHYVAIKSVEKSQRERLMNEVSILCQLAHPNVLLFLGWYETNNHLWLIMEYCTGGDLLTLLRQDKLLPEESIRSMSIDIISSLQYIHSKGYLYCDMKPSNLLLNEYGVLKICDLGLARQIPVDKAMLTAQASAKRGTPYYMSPELFHRDGFHSFASDLWAFGCVLYELASGKPPFYAKSLPDLVKLILTSPPAALPVSQEFNDLLFRLLDKDPLTRITWKELLAHPFFMRHEFPKLILPDQPLIKSTKNEKDVDISRLSMNATKHLNAEEEPVIEERPTSKSAPPAASVQESNLKQETKITSTGIEMNNFDIELNFGDKAAEPEPEDDKIPTPPIVEEDDPDIIDDDSEDSPFSVDVEIHHQLSSSTSDRPTSAPIENMRREEIMNEPKSIPTHARPSTSMNHISESSSSLKPAENLESHRLILGLDELLIHNSDIVVKPLVGNSKIEKNPDPKFDPKLLPFKCLSVDEITALETSDLEVFLTLLYKALNGDRDYSNLIIPPTISVPINASVNNSAQLKEKERICIISYFEFLCGQTPICNIIINSSLMDLMVALIWSNPASKVAVSPSVIAAAIPFKPQIIHIMGLLVRHATWIEGELAESGIVQALSELLRDKNLKVRRKAMAALGELMYYIATQQDSLENNGKASAWPITKFTINMIIRCLRAGEDDIVQHYAAKTVENISAQSEEFTRLWFGMPDLLYSLIVIYNSSCNEYLRLTAASSLSHLTRRHPNLFNSFLDKFGLASIRTGIENYALPRLQQSFLNIMNRALKEKLPRLSKMIEADKKFLPCIIQLLDHTSPIIRGKAVLCLCLLAQLHISWLIKSCELKLMNIIDKLIRDKDTYIRQCLQLFTLTCSELLTPLCSSLVDETKRIYTRRANIIAASKSLKEQVMPGLAIMFHLTSSLLLKDAGAVESAGFITQLSNMLPYVDLLACLGGAIYGEFKQLVFSVVESATQPASKLTPIAEVVISSLFPALLSLLKTSENGDIRFLALKVFSDLLMEFLTEKKVYDAVTANDKRNIANSGLVAAKTTKMINEMLVTNFLSNCKVVLSDKEPMPQYALKVLCAMVESNIMFIPVYIRFELVDIFTYFFAVNHPQMSTNVIKLMHSVCETKDIDRVALYTNGLTQKLLDLFNFSSANNISEWSEELLDLTNFLLSNALYCSPKGQAPSNEYSVASTSFQQVFNHDSSKDGLFNVFLSLLATSSPSIVEPTLACISQYAELTASSSSIDWLIDKTFLYSVSKACNEHNAGECIVTILSLFTWVIKNNTIKIALKNNIDFNEMLKKIALHPMYDINNTTKGSFVNSYNSFMNLYK